ncbi:MAG: 50S ribosomal protein L3 [Chlamydiae bacterium]|nr:50S ribosomal protein L3 [Chlamydiota bacterium]
MSLKLIGRKKGMTHHFDDQGNVIPCTVLQLKTHVVSQVKTLEKDGYESIQLATEKLTGAKRANHSKPQLGHFEKNSQEPRKYLIESKVAEMEKYPLGTEIDLSVFEGVKNVDVTAVSKGKGTQGVMKRHGFKGFGDSHGEGPIHRHGGSTGQRSSIGRVWKGRKMPGRMGNERVTIQNLKIVKIDRENEVILVKGAVPGSNNGIVEITKSVKGK